MLLSNTALLYAVLFIGVLLLVEGAYQLVVEVRAGPRAQINRRLQMLATGRDPHRVLAALRRDSQNARSWPLIGPLERLIAQAGMSVSPSRVLLWMALIGMLALIGLQLLTGAPVAFLLAPSAALGLGLPLLFLLRRKSQRVQLFEAQLPNALDLLVRSLRVGHPLSSALGVVAQEMPDPLGSEFGIVVDEVTYGQDIEEALDRMNERIDLQDLRYLTVAVQIQRTSGGNLAEVLDNLAKVIRDRFQMFRKVKAITAEGRLSSWFLSLFPIIMVLGVQLVKPDYYTQVADHPLFSILVAVTVVLLIVNVVFMRLLTKIKV